MPSTAPSDLPKLADLVFHRLCVRAHSHVQCRALVRHQAISVCRYEHPSIPHWYTVINCFRYAKSEIIRSLYLLGFPIAPRIGFSVCPPRATGERHDDCTRGSRGFRRLRVSLRSPAQASTPCLSNATCSSFAIGASRCRYRYSVGCSSYATARNLLYAADAAQTARAPPPLLRRPVGSHADIAVAHGILFNGSSKAPARDS